MSLISIIVPCYNQSQYMDECLQSVFDQTYQDWECIIVNDGSPDDTEEVAKKWTAKDARFKYLLKENGGLSSARNAGINIAQGEWILPLDCDDKIGNLYLELAEKEFNNGYTVIVCEAEFFGIKTGHWKLPEFSLSELAYDNIIFCSAFFKKETWEKVGGYDTNMIYGLEDWEFWISILKNQGKVFKIDKVQFYYRIKETSMITMVVDEKRLKMIRIIERKHLDFFQDQFLSINNIAHQLRNIEKKTTKLQSSQRIKIINRFFSLFGR